MTRFPRPAGWPVFALLTLLPGLGLASRGLAQGAAPPTVGSRNTATADPEVPRPHTTPCTVQLFSNVAFADFSPKPFSYAPPAACPGPWAKVVLVADFSITAGNQFDRTAQMALGHVNIYYGTTSEPSASFGPSWHVERDLTDYTALFLSPQTGETNLGNLVNSQFNSIITGSASLQFYPTSFFEPAPRTADAVVPLASAPGGAVLLASTTDSLAPSLSLPTNIEAAFLDVITQSQHDDEFWYTCVPNDAVNQLGGCGGTSFREGEVTVDGQPAGVAPVYPWIFTGGFDPFLWAPIPGVQTLNFVPYRVDLTPFAGVLSNGQPHQVGLSVFNSNNYFLVTGTLLLFRDHGSSQVTGAVTQNTLAAAPQPTVQENLTTASDGSITGSITTSATRRFTLAGFVNTSHGKIATTVAQEVDFSNVQQFVSSSTQFVQDITQKTVVKASTLSLGGAFAASAATFTYPLTLGIAVNLNPDGTLTEALNSSQKFQTQSASLGGGLPTVAAVSNAVTSSDTLNFNASGNFTGDTNRSSSQSYLSQSLENGCFSRSIASAGGVLTSVTDGQGCPGQVNSH